MHLTPTSVASEDSRIVYKTRNPYADEERDVLSFSDVPHVIKTVQKSGRISLRIVAVVLFG